jgi:hypothetical protein
LTAPIRQAQRPIAIAATVIISIVAATAIIMIVVATAIVAILMIGVRPRWASRAPRP